VTIEVIWRRVQPHSHIEAKARREIELKRAQLNDVVGASMQRRLFEDLKAAQGPGRRA
jgi:ppGpp synthetase/RelA/SpoT-type nucleotidyltranferase